MQANSAESKHLGLLWAQGPGEAAMTTDEGESWTANWANTLTMRPDGDEDLVIVDGAAQVRSTSQGRFTAEKFEIWLKTPTSPTGVNENGSTSGVSDVLPTRLQAFKDVIVSSPTLRAQVAVLKLWFDHITPAVQAPSIAQNVISQPAAPAIAESNSSQPQVLTSSLANQGTPISPLANAQLMTPPARRPLFADITTITGSTLEAKLKVSPGQDPLIEHLLLQGDVTMTKERVSDDFTLPATITGDQIEIEGSGPEQMLFHIFGEPARVLVGNGSVIGKSIHFDQQRQLLYMDQAGEMTVPPELLTQQKGQPIADPRLVSSTMEAPPLMSPQLMTQPTDQGRWVEAPRVVWNGQMTFDGHLAKLSKGVFIRGVWQADPKTLWHIESNSDEMFVEVSGSAFDRSKTQEPSKVEAVHLSGNVDIQAAQTNTQLERLSIEHLKLPLLTVYPQLQLGKRCRTGGLLSRRFNKKTDAAMPLKHKHCNVCI